MSKIRRAVPTISAAIDTCARSRHAARRSASIGFQSRSRPSVSRRKARREKSSVETKRRCAEAASVAITANRGPGPSTASLSTRSASSVNVLTGSSTNAYGAGRVVVTRERRVERGREERTRCRGVTGLLQEEDQVARGSGAERGVLAQVAPQRAHTAGSSMCAGRAWAGTRGRGACARCRGGAPGRR